MSMHARSGQMANAFDPDRVEELAPAVRDMVGRRARVLGPAYRLQYSSPIEFVRGEGVWLYDATGRPFLDAYNNVPSVGHCHPHVVEAITRQAARLNTNTRYLDTAILDYGERLLATHSAPIGNVMFTCTGSEANDLAIRIARNHTGAEGFIVTRNAYHGTTAATAEISPSLGRHVPIGRYVRTVDLPFGGSIRSAAERLRADVAGAVADLGRHGMRTAAIVIDTIFASDGILTEPAGFLADAVAEVRAVGGLVIADEVQPGFGRTGDAMWGYQRHGIHPDMAVMGKPMANGLPVAAMAADPAMLAAFGRESRYFNTFGGSTVSIAAAVAVLDVIEREDLLARAREVGSVLRARLEDRARPHPLLGEIRGAGMYIGIDMRASGDRPAGEVAAKFVNLMRDNAVLISATGAGGATLKIRPPLTFGHGDVEVFTAAFDASLSALS